MYKTDHIKVLRVLAGGLPKRQTFKTYEVVLKEFKNVASADRRVRNAYRKLRAEGHVEIADRGEYRLTRAGVGLCRKLVKADWDFSKVVLRRKIRKKVAK